jgi:MFS family permease
MPLELKEHEGGNIARCAVGEGLFGLGMGLMSVITVLPILLEKYLGAGDVQLGLAFSLGTAGWLLAQPLGMLALARRRRTKRFIIPWAFCFVVPPFLAMGTAVYLLGLERPRLCAAIVLGLLAVRIVGGGAAMPLWFDWQAMVFRRGIRGFAIGLIAGSSAVGAALAAVIAAGVRLKLDFPLNFALLFWAAVPFFAAGLTSYCTVREPDALREPQPTKRAADLLRLFRRSLGERNFRSYLIGRVLLTLGSGAPAFFAVHFSSPAGGDVPEATVFALGLFLTVASMASGPLLGRLGDRAGHKKGVLIGAGAQLVAIAVAAFCVGRLACGVTFALLGVAWSSSWVSHHNMLFETCPHDSRVVHITLSSMVLGPVLFLVPIATGWMMAHVPGRPTGIALTLVPGVLGLLWLIARVREPREIEVLPEALPSTQ